MVYFPEEGETMLTYLMIIDSDKDKDKFEQIYINYKGSMFKIANAILNDVGLAEDAVHQSFIKIMNNLHKIDDIFCNKTRAFIVIIVRNTATDMYRKRKKHNIIYLENMEKEPIDENISPLGFVIAEESFELMKNNISKIPQIYSDVIVLRYINGFTNSEIAKILNISNGNVRVRLHRAKKMLLEIIKKEASNV